MLLSGSIGVRILYGNHKYFIIFSDDHSNENYCNGEKFFIDDFINKFKNKYEIGIYVEELPDQSNAKSLWVSEHVSRLQKLINKCNTEKNCNNIYPSDIRMEIIPLDLSILKDNLKEHSTVANYKANIFFYNLIHFKEQLFMFLPYLNKSPNNEYLLKISYQLAEQIESHKILYSSDPMKDIINKIDIDSIDDIMRNMTDIYTLWLIYINNHKINILYFGLYHCDDICEHLKHLYNCEIKYNHKSHQSCTVLKLD